MLLPPLQGEQRAKITVLKHVAFYTWQRLQKERLLLPGRGLLKRIGAQLTLRFRPVSLCFMAAHGADGRLLSPAVLLSGKGCDKQTIYFAYSPLAA